KPAPDGALKALAALGAGREDALYIGDSEVDVQTAHNAGLRCVGVTWGFRDRQVLAAAGAEHLIDAPAQLMELIQKSM
ncbi:MAG: HAD family hydrolase, partial [Clostridiales bacterium]|nr:HAD family hydrolase [Clostridiales bacterium]